MAVDFGENVNEEVALYGDRDAVPWVHRKPNSLLPQQLAPAASGALRKWQESMSNLDLLPDHGTSMAAEKALHTAD